VFSANYTQPLLNTLCFTEPLVALLRAPAMVSAAGMARGLCRTLAYLSNDPYNQYLLGKAGVAEPLVVGGATWCTRRRRYDRRSRNGTECSHQDRLQRYGQPALPTQGWSDSAARYCAHTWRAPKLPNAFAWLEIPWSTAPQPSRGATSSVVPCPSWTISCDRRWHIPHRRLLPSPGGPFISSGTVVTRFARCTRPPPFPLRGLVMPPPEAFGHDVRYNPTISLCVHVRACRRPASNSEQDLGRAPAFYARHGRRAWLGKLEEGLALGIAVKARNELDLAHFAEAFFCVGLLLAKRVSGRVGGGGKREEKRGERGNCSLMSTLF